jgi:hypothetical protein
VDYVGWVDNLGPPVAYLVLADGVPVYDRDGARIGVVEHVLADEGADIFHGLLVRTPQPDRYLFAAREQIAELRQGGVTLAVRGAELHKPGEDPVAAEATEVSPGEEVQEGLRRAWRWLTEPR